MTEAQIKNTQEKNGYNQLQTQEIRDKLKETILSLTDEQAEYILRRIQEWTKWKHQFEPAPVSFGFDGEGGYAISPYPLADWLLEKKAVIAAEANPFATALIASME